MKKHVKRLLLCLTLCITQPSYAKTSDITEEIVLGITAAAFTCLGIFELWKSYHTPRNFIRAYPKTK